MAENATSKDSTSNDSARGVPYYEKLRKDLQETIHKKRLLDKNIVCTSIISLIVRRPTRFFEGRPRVLTLELEFRKRR